MTAVAPLGETPASRREGFTLRYRPTALRASYGGRLRLAPREKTALPSQCPDQETVASDASASGIVSEGA
ncbi:hypothetical protein [Nostoc sp.]|uniref:hypothetical protein n=1 Tax=Nostoc sp. TaxID=1180 RepID=UPI002FFC9069